MKHDDDDPVMVGYASSRNIYFRDTVGEELGLTWGEWRDLSDEAQGDYLAEHLSSLVDVWVIDEEED